jgi:hypothetical protein
LKAFTVVGVIKFLASLFVWECILIIGEYVEFLRHSAISSIQPEDVEVFTPHLMLGVVAVAIICAIGGNRKAGESLLLGAAISIVVTVLGGYIWARNSHGFHLPAGIFLASLFLSPVAAIGGAVVGWLNRA